MKPRLNRRQLLKASCAATAAWVGTEFLPGSARAIDYTKPVPEAENLTAYLNGANLLVRWHNLPVLGYRAHPTLKYPYFCPLNGPISGLSLTTESALPYPHHRGLWLGCQPLNDGDYWSDGPLEQGRIESTTLELEPDTATKTSAAFRHTSRWVRDGAPSPFDDQRRYVVTVLNEHVRLLDCDIELLAKEDIEIAKAKHSFFAMRAAADISPTYGGVMMNSEGGVGAEGTYGKPAAWCGYHGKRRLRPDVVEGIAIMNHPDNFGGDCPWFTRDYGHLSPSPFNFREKPWRLPKGQSLKLRYRVALHAGTPREAGLDRIYEDWLQG